MIRLENINLFIDKKHILKDINLEIKSGEIVLLCGKSGGGKSSIINIINTLIPNYYQGKVTGNVIVDNKLVNDIPLYDISKYIYTIFQNPRTQFFATNTTSELAFTLENYGVDARCIIDKINEEMNRYNFNELLGRNIFRLSGGEKQLIACMSAIISNPKVFLFDEPSSNLSQAKIAFLVNILFTLKKQKKTILIAEHRLFFLKGLIDRVIIIDNGEIIQDISANDFWNFNLTKQKKYFLRNFVNNDISHIASIDKESNNLDIKNALVINKLKYSYDNKNIVIDIPNLVIPRGKVIAIIGENGVGKTTFINILSGLIKQKEGEFFLNQKLLSRKTRIKISYLVMQDVNRQLFTNTVLSELTFGVDKTKKSNDEILNILNDIDLDSYKDEHPMILSGGQKQRLIVSSASLQEKEIYIFDEPTSGLDYIRMLKVANQLKALASLNKFVIVITHDYELINYCANILLPLNKV